MHDCISTNCVLKYSRAKAGEPTGDPRRRKPVVISAGSGGPRISMLFDLVEYLRLRQRLRWRVWGLVRGGPGVESGPM